MPDWLSITELHFTDANPNRGDVQAIANSIRQFGYNDTLHVYWSPTAERWHVKGGEHRIKALLQLQGEGYAPRPDWDQRLRVSDDGVWQVAVQDVSHLPDELTANAFMLAVNRTQRKGYDDPELTVALLEAMEDDLQMAAGYSMGEVQALLSDSQKEAEEKYTRKIEPPIYVPNSDTPPDITDLYDTATTDKLVSSINADDQLSDDEKQFLIAAAQRHTVFNFDNIAEYYAHAPKTVQRYFEDSALVIIDFDRAIELGFVKLSQELLDLYGVDHDK